MPQAKCKIDAQLCHIVKVPHECQQEFALRRSIGAHIASCELAYPSAKSTPSLAS